MAEILTQKIHQLIKDKQYQAAGARLQEINVNQLSHNEQDDVLSLINVLHDCKVDLSASLCFSAFYLSLLMGDTNKIKLWHQLIQSKKDNIKSQNNERRMFENRLLCVSICMPSQTISNLLLNLAILANEYGAEDISLAKISFTCGFPSVLRGLKDLSEWTKYYSATASIIKPLMNTIISGGDTGVCETWVSELLYEKNDLHGASLGLGGTLHTDNVDIYFAALSTMARLGAVDGAAKRPEEVLKAIKSLLDRENAYWLMPSYEALGVRFAMLRGDKEKVSAWLKTCIADELHGFALRDYYLFITKAKAYIALGEYKSATTLLESIVLSLSKHGRTLDIIECLINCAIACELSGDTTAASDRLERAIIMAQEYSYIRVFADCGICCYSLLSRCTKDNVFTQNVNESFLKKITDASKSFAIMCPSLYVTTADKKSNDKKEGKCDIDLTSSELLVLGQLAQGKTNKEIGAELHIEITTVRFHMSKIMQKLSATNRTEVITKANRINLLK